MIEDDLKIIDEDEEMMIVRDRFGLRVYMVQCPGTVKVSALTRCKCLLSKHKIPFTGNGKIKMDLIGSEKMSLAGLKICRYSERSSL